MKHTFEVENHVPPKSLRPGQVILNVELSLVHKDGSMLSLRRHVIADRQQGQIPFAAAICMDDAVRQLERILDADDEPNDLLHAGNPTGA